jgi:hypothetical protein
MRIHSRPGSDLYWDTGTEPKETDLFSHIVKKGKEAIIFSHLFAYTTVTAVVPARKALEVI